MTGSDVNPLETEGIFTALSRLHAALQANDVSEIGRAIEMFEQQMVELNYARAELGARQQRLDSMQDRLEAENIDLQAALSEEYDAALVETVSEYATLQTAYEASLKAIGGVLRLSLLDYI